MPNLYSVPKRDWKITPQSVRNAVTALDHQVRMFQIRFTAYEKKIADLEEKAKEVDSLKIEVADLREQLNMNSRNSSKPPSSDPPNSRRQSHRESSGKKQGAQTGHTGHGRELKPIEEVDHIVDLRPLCCESCGCQLSGDDPNAFRHQVTEIPSVKAQTTEYRRHSLKCQQCGTVNKTKWSEEVPDSSFGPRVQALVAYLTGRLGLSHRDVVEALDSLYGVEMSLGSVSAIQHIVSQALAHPIAEALEYVKQQAIMYVDETRWSQCNKGIWLWLNSTRFVTVFRLLDRRDQNAARAVIGEIVKGIVTTDRYSSYSWLSNDQRQLCWSHLKRDFQAITDRGGEPCRIGQALLKQTKKVFSLWRQLKEGKLEWESFQQKMKPVRERVKSLLEKGSRCSHKKTAGTCQQILKNERAMWTFTRVRGVEPTNNRAERGLRRAVLWRKKSFGTQSETGSRFVERIMTTVESLRQQCRNVLEFLTQACAPVKDDYSISLIPNTS